MGGFRVLHRPLGWGRSLLAGTAGVIPVLAKLPVDKVTKYTPLGLPVVKWCADWTWIAVPCSVAVATALGFIRRKIVDPETDESLQDILNHLHSQMFPNAVDERARLTLFRFHRWQLKRWPWRPRKGGWLVAVKRSGEMQQDFSARFQIGEELAGDCGIAGKAWCDIADAFVENLPDVSTGRAPKRDIDRYARETCTSSDWVRRNAPKSRSFYGMKIRHKQRKWGVIVIDSTDPQLDQPRIVQVFANTQRFLSLYASKV